MFLVAADPGVRIGAHGCDPPPFGPCEFDDALHQTTGGPRAAERDRSFHMLNDEHRALTPIIREGNLSVDVQLEAASVDVVMDATVHRSLLTLIYPAKRRAPCPVPSPRPRGRSRWRTAT